MNLKNNERQEYIQQKWKQGTLVGLDCVLFGNGTVIIGNCYSIDERDTNKKKWYWFPLCDTTIDSIEKYEPDIWTEINVYRGSIEYGEQTIVFGEGSMGNEGFVASKDKVGNLNWGIFFTFSNPINEIQIQDDMLFCNSDNEVIQIIINLKDLTKIEIKTKDFK